MRLRLTCMDKQTTALRTLSVESLREQRSIAYTLLPDFISFVAPKHSQSNQHTPLQPPTTWTSRVLKRRFPSQPKLLITLSVSCGSLSLPARFVVPTSDPNLTDLTHRDLPDGQARLQTSKEHLSDYDAANRRYGLLAQRRPSCSLSKTAAPLPRPSAKLARWPPATHPTHRFSSPISPSHVWHVIPAIPRHHRQTTEH